MGSKKCMAWLPTKESGFMDSRKKIAGTVMRWRTVSSASRSRSASSSGASTGTPPPAGPACLLPSSVFEGDGELRFHKRHDLISVSSEREPYSAIRLEPVSFLERAQEHPAAVDRRSPHLAPGPRPGDAQRPDLDRLGREPVVRLRDERSDRHQNEHRSGQ